MLVKFTVENFRSIAEPVTFSMEADKDTDCAIATGLSAAPHLLGLPLFTVPTVRGKATYLQLLRQCRA